MRKLVLAAALAAFAMKASGCGGEPPKPSTNPAADNPNLPGVPTEGPEAPKAKKR